MKTLYLFLFSFIIGYAGPRDQIRSILNDADIYTVEPTGSMEPVLNEKCYLLIKIIPFNELKIGDIIVFQRNDTLIVHRIISFSDSRRYAATKGDANQTSDVGYVTEENYRGIVFGVIRRDLLDPEEKLLTTPVFLIK